MPRSDGSEANRPEPAALIVTAKLAGCWVERIFQGGQHDAMLGFRPLSRRDPPAPNLCARVAYCVQPIGGADGRGRDER